MTSEAWEIRTHELDLQDASNTEKQAPLRRLQVSVFGKPGVGFQIPGCSFQADPADQIAIIISLLRNPKTATLHF